MKSSEMLKKAKELLWDGVSPCVPTNINTQIYDALEKAVGWGDSRDMCEEIKRRLCNYFYVTNWLHFVAGVPKEQLTPENVQAYIHRWFEHMIDEYQSKGD